MNTTVMHDTLAASEAGQLTFPNVVKALTEVGVESYLIDLASGSATYYMTSGETHSERLSPLPGEVAQEFSLSDLRTAIRMAQTDQIRYPEFLRRSLAAGTVAYWAYLTGKKVIYFGRKGEIHIEEFPKPAQ
jgi:uncharacterized protein YbcV (DUF1398 family)